MRIKLLHIFSFVILILYAIILYSCEAALLEGVEAEGVVGELATEGITAEDMGLLRESGVELNAAGDLVVTNETAFCSELERVRIEESTLGSSRLYLFSENEPFAEVIDKNKIKLTKYNKVLELPGDIYKVKGNNVNVRSGPGLNYQVFKKVSTGQIVLVKAEENGWSTVQLGDRTFGYISTALLAVIAVSNHKNTITNPESSDLSSNSLGTNWSKKNEYAFRSYKGEAKTIYNNFLEISLYSFQINGKEIKAYVNFKNKLHRRYGIRHGDNIGIAFQIEAPRNISGRWEFPPEAKATLEDISGYKYNLLIARGIGFARTLREWTILKPEESRDASFTFIGGNHEVGDTFTLNIKVWYVVLEPFRRPVSQSVSISFNGINVE